MLATSRIGNARLKLLGIEASEAALERRGFAATTPDKRRHLEDAGEAIIKGYRAALTLGDAPSTGDYCNHVPTSLRGFAFEGAAMGLSVIDLLTSTRPRRLAAFVDGPGALHKYTVHVGAGRALARCPWGSRTFYPSLDPLLRSAAVDGVGFHQAYFSPRRYIERRRVSWMRRLAPAAFDNGIGRALWFAAGADARRATAMIERFQRERRAALWGGWGMALTYVGGASSAELADVRQAAGAYRYELMVGAAFAARARARAGDTTPETTLACRVLCRCEPEQAATATDHALRRLPRRRDTTSYELWRRLTAVELSRLSGEPTPHFALTDDDAATIPSVLPLVVSDPPMPFTTPPGPHSGSSS